MYGHVVHAHYPLHGLPPCETTEGPLGSVELCLGAVPLHLQRSALTRPTIEVSPEAVLIKPRFGGQELGRILVREGREIIVAPVLGQERDLEPYILGSGMGALCLQNGLLPLHASAVTVGSAAIAFAGVSGAGKSTMAAAMIARGFARLTDDLSIVRRRADGGIEVYPGPPVMKLSPESAAALGVDIERAQPESRHHRKQRFNAEASTTPNRPERLAAIYFLALNDGPEVSIEPLSGVHAVAAINREIYRRGWLAPMGLLEARLQDIVALASGTPCFRLRRPHRFDLLPTVVETVLQHQATLHQAAD
jgi:hypothetical protein